jgi:hypothetical protein
MIFQEITFNSHFFLYNLLLCYRYKNEINQLLINEQFISEVDYYYY